MSVLKSITSSVLKDVTRSILRGDDDTSRFLTTLIASGSMSFAFAATLVIGTGITLTVYPTNGTQGLPPGAPAVTDNQWQTITYTTTGNVTNLGFDGVDHFDGIIWDYSAPSISVALALGENFGTTTTAKNSLDPSGATDATAVNISESDLFTQQENGDYLGVERWTFGDYTFTGSEPTSTLVIGTTSSAGIIIGNSYKWTYDFNEVNASAGIRLRVGDLANDSPDSGSFEGIKLVTTGDDLYFQTVGGPVPGAGSTITNQSTKQILQKA